MRRAYSVRDLRNETAKVVAAVEAGEEVTLMVNRRPVAEIIPHRHKRSPWVSSAELLDIREHAPLDADFLADVADVRNMLIDE